MRGHISVLANIFGDTCYILSNYTTGLCTVRSRYLAVSFLHITHEHHQNIGAFVEFGNITEVSLSNLACSVQYRVILYHNVYQT